MGEIVSQVPRPHLAFLHRCTCSESTTVCMCRSSLFLARPAPPLILLLSSSWLPKQAPGIPLTVETATATAATATAGNSSAFASLARSLDLLPAPAKLSTLLRRASTPLSFSDGDVSGGFRLACLLPPAAYVREERAIAQHSNTNSSLMTTLAMRSPNEVALAWRRLYVCLPPHVKAGR